MRSGIEQLLRLTADYHNFCNGNELQNQEKDEDELCLMELDTVAAAAGRIPEEIIEDKL